MKATHIISTGIILCIIAFSCKKEDETESLNVSETSVKTEETKFPLSGTYTWNFEIPGMGSQVSTHTFYADSIGYEMTGAAYTTRYSMTKHSYTDKEKKWIGLGKGGSIPKDGSWFVLFFKNITDTSVMIYKREFENGKEEVENLQAPDDNTTADHGWNLYVKE